MRIVQVIDTLNAGGAERVLVDIANLLVRRNNEVTVLIINQDGPLSRELDQSVKRIVLNRGVKYNPGTARKFVSLLNTFDVVHIHMRHVLKYYWFSSFWKRCTSSIFFHDHFGDIQINQNVPAYMKLLTGKIKYIAVSRQLQEWAITSAGFRKEETFLLPNIIMNQAAKRTARELKGPDTKKRIIIVSNFKRTKNIEFALELAHSLKSELDFVMHIFGGDQDRPYRLELEQLLATHNLEHHVHLYVNETNVRERLAGYDLAIHCAVSETGPLVLIEYLASHLPFLAYETGEVVRQLKPHFPLFFIDNFEITSWKKRITILFSDYSQLDHEKFDLIFKDYYSENAYTDKLLKMYINSSD